MKFLHRSDGHVGPVRSPTLMTPTRNSSGPGTIELPGSDLQVRHEGLYEVVLFNDDVNAVDHVIQSLVQVFHHSLQLAVKITIEAHRKGRAIAEVESRSKAQLHKDQLQSLGLTAEIEKVG
ncbi:MAG: ATP-dependent Clp protease adaptor ClpS [Verrucomicrobia bacterium]|jgi:ATP-dependent Clp protease adaptor protein ClpS|nr:ATP-dependent Clp protease adaptor ClpS [Verrucomicrobiota bacterium]MBT7700670.1 ATP-dependent Clp protease adaptor ClpS [Verrucomicrobiota bacterium]